MKNGEDVEKIGHHRLQFRRSLDLVLRACAVYSCHVNNNGVSKLGGEGVASCH